MTASFNLSPLFWAWRMLGKLSAPAIRPVDFRKDLLEVLFIGSVEWGLVGLIQGEDGNQSRPAGTDNGFSGPRVSAGWRAPMEGKRGDSEDLRWRRGSGKGRWGMLKVMLFLALAQCAAAG